MEPYILKSGQKAKSRSGTSPEHMAAKMAPDQQDTDIDSDEHPVSQVLIMSQEDSMEASATHSGASIQLTSPD